MFTGRFRLPRLQKIATTNLLWAHGIVIATLRQTQGFCYSNVAKGVKKVLWQLCGLRESASNFAWGSGILLLLLNCGMKEISTLDLLQTLLQAQGNCYGSSDCVCAISIFHQWSWFDPLVVTCLPLKSLLPSANEWSLCFRMTLS